MERHPPRHVLRVSPQGHDLRRYWQLEPGRTGPLPNTDDAWAEALTDADRALIAERVRADPARRILITHGTDTMAETARSLGDTGDKTVVFVGSLSPARFKGTDAEFNIGFALAAVQLLPPGAYVAMNGCIFRADEVKKNRTANRFEGDPYHPPGTS